MGAEQHLCKGPLPDRSYGAALDSCWEEDGEFWIGNGEYASQVFFCPYCGKKAPKEPEEVKNEN